MTDQLKDLVKSINQRYGENTIVRLGDYSQRLKVDVISTGSLTLDLALGVGGIPRCRTTEIYGPENSGKTSIALHVCAEAQKKGLAAAYIDVECALDPDHAIMCGVDLNNLYYITPDTGEKAIDVCYDLLASEKFGVVVIDSVSALEPEAEAKADMSEQQMGLQARLMSKAMRKLTSIIGKSGAALIFINQIREKIGVMYGNPETTSGGRALRYYGSVRIEVRRGEDIKQGKQVVGHVVKCLVKKNKVGIPFKTAEYRVIYGKGIDTVGEVIALAPQVGLVQKSGGWYSILDEMGKPKLSPNGEPLKWHGEDAFRQAVEADPALLRELTDGVRRAVLSQGTSVDLASGFDE